MKTSTSRNAFTLMELLVVIAVILFVVIMILPATSSHPHYANRINCVNNLKEVGLAVKIWEGDNGDRYPMAVPCSLGGAEDYTYKNGMTNGTSPTFTSSTLPGVAVIYGVMSNELSTPKILYCPADSSRHVATNFSELITPTATNTSPYYRISGTAQSCLSYAICGDAADAYPQMILSAERNIGRAATVGDPAGFNNPPTNTITSPASMHWTRSKVWSWTQHDIHLNGGNIGLADGSVQQCTSSNLQTALLSSVSNTPYSSLWFNFPQ